MRCDFCNGTDSVRTCTYCDRPMCRHCRRWPRDSRYPRALQMTIACPDCTAAHAAPAEVRD